jgi:hypothetical protein
VGLTIEVQVVAAEGARPSDFSRLELVLYPIDMVRFADMLQPRKFDNAGKVRLVGVPAASTRVFASGLNAAHHVKEIRYNDVTLANDIIPLDQPVAGYHLALVLDDKPGTITGTVKNGDKPAG